MEPSERQRLMARGREAFNRGEFFEAHELWEEVWKATDGPERAWVQGMIQIAAGLHKLQHHRPDVCAKLLRRALIKLSGAPETIDGCDLGALRRDTAQVLADIERPVPPDPVSLPVLALPPPGSTRLPGH